MSRRRLLLLAVIASSLAAPSIGCGVAITGGIIAVAGGGGGGGGGGSGTTSLVTLRIGGGFGSGPDFVTTVVDVERDGSDDLVVDRGGAIDLLTLGDPGDGELDQVPGNANSVQSTLGMAIATGDLDGDGMPELLRSRSGLLAFPNGLTLGDPLAIRSTPSTASTSASPVSASCWSPT